LAVQLGVGMGPGGGDAGGVGEPCIQHVSLLTGVASSLPGFGTQPLGQVYVWLPLALTSVSVQVGRQQSWWQARVVLPLGLNRVPGGHTQPAQVGDPGAGLGLGRGLGLGLGEGGGEGEGLAAPCTQHVYLPTGVASSLPGFGTQPLGQVYVWLPLVLTSVSVHVGRQQSWWQARVVRPPGLGKVPGGHTQPAQVGDPGAGLGLGRGLGVPGGGGGLGGGGGGGVGGGGGGTGDWDLCNAAV
jgi:hypothetical protein